MCTARNMGGLSAARAMRSVGGIARRRDPGGAGGGGVERGGGYGTPAANAEADAERTAAPPRAVRKQSKRARSKDSPGRRTDATRR